MRFPEAFDGTFGPVHFGEAPVSDQLLAHPQGTLPAKLPDPHQLDAAYCRFKADDVTHQAVVHAHSQLTHRRMVEHHGDLVLIAPR